MKATKKPVRRKIVVALLGMCLAVSSYTVPRSEASIAQEQVTPAPQIAAGTTTVQSAPAGPQSQLLTSAYYRDSLEQFSLFPKGCYQGLPFAHATEGFPGVGAQLEVVLGTEIG